MGKNVADRSGSNIMIVIGNEVEGFSGLSMFESLAQSSFHRRNTNANDVTTKFVDWVEKDFLDLDNGISKELPSITTR